MLAPKAHMLVFFPRPKPEACAVEAVVDRPGDSSQAGVVRGDGNRLSLFLQAAERDAATAGLARQIFLFLERARRNPNLRFEAAE